MIAALGVVAVMLAPACSKSGAPSALFDASGYYVRGDKVYYLKAFPGSAFAIDGADAATFKTLDTTYGSDRTAVFVDGVALPGADPATFRLLDREGFGKDAQHVFQRDRAISSDPDHFELIAADLAKDGAHVYWSDGSVLSDDPAHFVIVSNTDHYLFTKDGRTVHVNGKSIAGADPATFGVLSGAYARDEHGVYYFTDRVNDAATTSFEVLADSSFARDAARAYWMGKPIPGADAATFRVLNANFECSADSVRAYYQDTAIVAADPRTFPPGKAVTGCSATSISFSE
jgi:hypothetical protein